MQFAFARTILCARAARNTQRARPHAARRRLMNSRSKVRCQEAAPQFAIGSRAGAYLGPSGPPPHLATPPRAKPLPGRTWNAHSERETAALAHRAHAASPGHADPPLRRGQQRPPLGRRLPSEPSRKDAQVRGGLARREVSSRPRGAMHDAAHTTPNSRDPIRR